MAQLELTFIRRTLYCLEFQDYLNTYQADRTLFTNTFLARSTPGIFFWSVINLGYMWAFTETSNFVHFELLLIYSMNLPRQHFAVVQCSLRVCKGQ